MVDIPYALQLGTKRQRVAVRGDIHRRYPRIAMMAARETPEGLPGSTEPLLGNDFSAANGSTTAAETPALRMSPPELQPPRLLQAPLPMSLQELFRWLLQASWQPSWSQEPPLTGSASAPGPSVGAPSAEVAVDEATGVSVLVPVASPSGLGVPVPGSEVSADKVERNQNSQAVATAATALTAPPTSNAIFAGLSRDRPG